MRSLHILVTPALLFVSLLSPGIPAGAQESPPAQPLSIEEVVKMHQKGFSDDVIVTRIRKNGKAFNLNSDEMSDLQKAGLSDTVMQFLLDPSQPYTAAPPPVRPVEAPGAARKVTSFPADDRAQQVPPEPGLYRFAGGKPARIEAKLLLTTSAGGRLAKVMKSKAIAYLVGTRAVTRVAEQTPGFYLRLPEGKGIEEIVLVRLDRKGDRRELDIGPSAKKQELNSDDIRPFDSLAVAPQLYRLYASKLSAGEYLFFQIGSADPAKGTAGKGFDFGIDAAVKTPPK